MTEYIQLHMLVSYPPSNLNRDDLGRPKTAMMGGVQRLRVSSQSLKRAWRTSEQFKTAFGGHMGIRTKEIGWNVYLALRSGRTLANVVTGTRDPAPVRNPVPEKNAVAWGKAVAGTFGKLKDVKTVTTEKQKKESLCVEQMVHFSPDEIAAIDDLLQRLAETGTAPVKEDLSLLRQEISAVDIAMFGRMLAAHPSFNCDAAVQVAHAITVHRVGIEDDYFTAVDDLNRNAGDDGNGNGNGAGAGHVGQAEFAAGLYYAYLCINRDLLVENLGGDASLADQAVRSLIETATKVSPTGKQNSFASRAYASYVLAERGEQQPRSLSVAFLRPVVGDDYMASAVGALESTRQSIDAVYGACADAYITMNAVDGIGSLEDVLAFAAGDHA